MAKFEILTGEDADRARLAGSKLQVYWPQTNEWRDRDLPDMRCDSDALYRIKHGPKTIRKPLADLRVLAGAMLVDSGGEYVGIESISPLGKTLLTSKKTRFTGQDLINWGYHYNRGNGPQPCRTEEEE